MEEQGKAMKFGTDGKHDRGCRDHQEAERRIRARAEVTSQTERDAEPKYSA